MSKPSEAPQMIGLYLQLRSTYDDAAIMEVSGVLDDLEDGIVSVSWERTADGWMIFWVLDALPDLKKVIKAIKSSSGITVSEEDFAWQDIDTGTNWLEESYRSFPPFRVGSFFVFGSHYDGKIPKGTIPLQIDAATAFGSGEHGTTRGCLEALLKLHKSGFKPKRILDMGSGSGILAIAAYKLWKKPVLAVDIDKEATRMATHHRKINQVPSGDKGMQCATGDGYKARAVKVQKGGFDLIIANILAGPLVEMAPELADNLKEGGKTILSGLLIEQEDKVLAAHAACGLKRPSRLPRGEWQNLILNK